MACFQMRPYSALLPLKGPETPYQTDSPAAAPVGLAAAVGVAAGATVGDVPPPPVGAGDEPVVGAGDGAVPPQAASTAAPIPRATPARNRRRVVFTCSNLHEFISRRVLMQKQPTPPAALCQFVPTVWPILQSVDQQYKQFLPLRQRFAQASAHPIGSSAASRAARRLASETMVGTPQPGARRRPRPFVWAIASRTSAAISSGIPSTSVRS